MTELSHLHTERLANLASLVGLHISSLPLRIDAGLLEPVRQFVASGKPVWGVCAGMVLLAEKLLDSSSQPLSACAPAGAVISQELPLCFPD